jgi:phenylacetate-CoA ligase
VSTLDKARWSIAHAYANTAYYRAKCDAACIAPDDLRSLDDLARFPFTLKTDFREHYPWGMCAVPRERLARIHASSGTTGKPTIVGYTKNDLDLWNRLIARSIQAAGGRPGDLLHNAYGYGLFTGGLGLHGGAEAMGCAVVPASGGQTERQIQLILDLKPRVICCTPSYMLVLAEALQRAGVDPRTTSLEIGSMAPSHGATRCRRRSSGAWAPSRSTSMACRKCSARAWPWNAPMREARSPSGKTNSIPRSSIR